LCNVNMESEIQLLVFRSLFKFRKFRVNPGEVGNTTDYPDKIDRGICECGRGSGGEDEWESERDTGSTCDGEKI
jgi:hypothetical protein